MLGMRIPTLARLLLLAPLLMAADPQPPPTSGFQYDDPSDQFFRMEGVPDDIDEPWQEFIAGWSAFLDAHFMLQELITLLLAAGLAALIAYHPRSRPPIPDAAGVERPKVMVIYGVVCAAIAEIVLFNPPMAFVIFGLGSLLRFRSLIGSPKDTGRIILVAIMGLACGLKFFPVAVLGTAFGWILIWFLESSVAVTVELRELAGEDLDAAAAAWRRALEEKGCRIAGTRARPSKGRLELLVLVPRRGDLPALRDSLDLPSTLRDGATWEWQP